MPNKCVNILYFTLILTFPFNWPTPKATTSIIIIIMMHECYALCFQRVTFAPLGLRLHTRPGERRQLYRSGTRGREERERGPLRQSALLIFVQEGTKGVSQQRRGPQEQGPQTHRRHHGHGRRSGTGVLESRWTVWRCCLLQQSCGRMPQRTWKRPDEVTETGPDAQNNSGNEATEVLNRKPTNFKIHQQF